MTGSEPASDPLIGKSLSHFRIDAKLGEGGMGVVYRATDERLRRVVALKVLPDALASDPERRRRFLREARAAAAVTHPNIAAVYDIGEADGHVFIAMELLSGETPERLSAEWARSRALPVGPSARLGRGPLHTRHGYGDGAHDPQMPPRRASRTTRRRSVR
jgi:serine/threonine-protein kinase